VGYSVFGYNVAAQRITALQTQGQLLSIQEMNYNTPLQPESSLNSNLGAFFQKGKWKTDFNLFYNQIQNLIDTRAVARYTNGQAIFSYFNVNKIFTYGAEINVSYTPFKHLMLAVGYQYLVAKDEGVLEQLNEGKIFARNPVTLNSFKLQQQDYFGLYNRSRHLANFKINYEIEKWKTNVFLRVFYRSRYGLFDSNNNSILDNYDAFVRPYFLMNIAINQTISKHFSAQIGVNNLLNFTDAANIPNIAGRQPFAKIQYNF
jgi:outer membrane receptor for ferrienterochelin and colicins